LCLLKRMLSVSGNILIGHRCVFCVLSTHNQVCRLLGIFYLQQSNQKLFQCMCNCRVGSPVIYLKLHVIFWVAFSVFPNPRVNLFCAKVCSQRPSLRGGGGRIGGFLYSTLTSNIVFEILWVIKKIFVTHSN
jgi:hypothetical protein